MRIHHKPFLLVFFLCLSSLVAAQFTPGYDEDRPGGIGSGETSSPGSQGNDNTDKSSKTGIDTLRIRAFHIDEFLGEKSIVSLDTFSLNFQNNTFPERLNTVSGSHLGNFGSPFQSRIFKDRTEKSVFFFMRPYEQWIKYPGDFIFMNTTKPYSNLKYLTTFGNDKTQEEDFKFTFTGNVNKYLNIGVDYEIIYSRGFYSQSSTRDKLGNIFGNYQSPRYEAFWKVSYNYLENHENGGITDDRYITQPLLMSGGLREYESLNIPVYLTDARNMVKNHQLFFNHKYHLGFERVDKNDSLLMEFVPVTSIIHTLYIDRNQKGYYSKSVNKQFYDTIANIDENFTADTSALFYMRNTIGLSMREGFHDWVKMGLTAFIEHDFRKYTELSPDADRTNIKTVTEKAEIWQTRLSPGVTLSDSSNIYNRYTKHYENLIWTGAEIYKRQGSVLTYSALAKLCIMGEDIGDFELSSNLNTDFTLFKHPVLLAANGYIKNRHPDYFLEHYYSNHFSWNNSFNNEYKTNITGSLDIPYFGFSFNASVENLTNYVFFNNKALPEQYIGNIQVLTANWKQNLHLGILHWDNDIIYQISSDKTRLPLPKLTIYSNVYFKTTLSKVLTARVGVDCRYFTSYYANSYMPATGQFHTQQDVMIGNYPYMNAYGNFLLKRMRFFVMYSHLSRLFADPQYFSTPHYPLNPAAVKVGLSWNFYD